MNSRTALTPGCRAQLTERGPGPAPYEPMPGTSSDRPRRGGTALRNLLYFDVGYPVRK